MQIASDTEVTPITPCISSTTTTVLAVPMESTALGRECCWHLVPMLSSSWHPSCPQGHLYPVAWPWVPNSEGEWNHGAAEGQAGEQRAEQMVPWCQPLRHPDAIGPVS